MKISPNEDNIKKEKKLIRESFKLIRNNLDSNFIKDKSSIISKKFRNIVNINKFNSICVYADFNNEVPTEEIIKYALKNNIKVSVPFLIDNHNMKLKYINDYDKDINRNTKFGCGEPFEYCKDCDINEVSMFIIPALVFDEKCNRLGFGRGYYDNILRINKSALRIGLAYDYQILPSIPKDDNDEILDIIISESKVITATF
ncbi:5-formyltetrahydrofolate cyclo-ligase [Brachyspira hampsonii]|uniref:5-formyltetrahydrofolate cyclo-ligase n=1 Tax=Brachyspira hampsonii 30446 TaxID=1289135 RepID=A0A2U4FIV6_9SPIR|nr:5-formyltetrahydrofolate cyclo-ligase [Brachyspira hampsonii 30446]MBW5391029.1 5-formyltetrahydrofolate cyclo-ligase [Brachyspira hampsonii]MBW5395139.1 5-formyltetrahydrofolate cyclo-ligase [Brachyspira hampsonii]